MQYRNINEALPALAEKVMDDGDELGSRGGERVQELLHQQITLTHPTERYVTLSSRKASLPAQIAETMWVLAGRDDVEWLSHYLPRAADFSDDGKVWRGGYGPRLRSWSVGLRHHGTAPLNYSLDQLAHVVGLLKRDPQTRRAVISLYDPAVDYPDSKDVPCNNWLSFTSRLGKLHLNVATRSNDLIWGWSGINAFEWSALQEIVAGLLGIEVGMLTFNITSLHVYDRHWPRAERIADEVPDLTGVGAKFRMPAGLAGVAGLDALVKDWFIVEQKLRAGDSEAYKAVDAFPEPMLQSWLRVIEAYWSGDENDLDALGESSSIHRAALLSPKRKATKTELAQEGERISAFQRRQTPDPFNDYLVELHKEKHAVYGDSWKKRGEAISIQANIARKIDRLGVGGAGDTAADTVIDLLVYLVKYHQWLRDLEDGPVAVTPALRQLPRDESMAEGGVQAAATRIKCQFEILLRGETRRDRLGLVESMLGETIPLARYLWVTEQAPAQGHAERNATRSWNPEA